MEAGQSMVHALVITEAVAKTLRCQAPLLCPSQNGEAWRSSGAKQWGVDMLGSLEVGEPGFGLGPKRAESPPHVGVKFDLNCCS